ncbi:MAG: hypothetical protein NVS3B20_20670 [Polyangiales bacterium]
MATTSRKAHAITLRVDEPMFAFVEEIRADLGRDGLELSVSYATRWILERGKRALEGERARRSQR